MASKQPTDPSRHATYRQAERGIYLDFESFEEQAPNLMGILVESELTQVVLDAVLKSAAEAKQLRVSELGIEMENLVKRARDERRYIFAFTRHELDVVRKHTVIADDFASLYKDGHKIAKRWFNRFHRGEFIEGRRLADFMEFTGNKRPSYLGSQQAAQRLRHVRDMLIRRRAYDRLTPVGKAKWSKLLAHNALDCTGLRDLVLRATREMEEISA